MGDGRIQGRPIVANGPDLDLIKSWMSPPNYGCGVEWTDYHGTQRYSRPQMLALIDSGRLTIERYSQGAIHGALDGEPVYLLVPLYHYGASNCVGNCDETDPCGYGTPAAPPSRFRRDDDAPCPCGASHTRSEHGYDPYPDGY